MPFVKWNDCFGEEDVYCYKNSTGSKPFKEHVALVLNILVYICVDRLSFNNESYQNKNMK